MSDDKATAQLIAQIADLRNQLTAVTKERDDARSSAQQAKDEANRATADAAAQVTRANEAVAQARKTSAASVAELTTQRDRAAATASAATSRLDTATANWATERENLGGQIQTLNDQLAATNIKAAQVDALERRVAMLEPLATQFTSDLPKDVTMVHYLDEKGNVDKKRFRTSDGTKFSVRAEADAYQAALDIMKTLGTTLEIAKEIVAKKDQIKSSLDTVK